MNEFDKLVSWIEKSDEKNIDKLIFSCMRVGWSYEISISAIEIALDIKINKSIIPNPISMDKRNIDVGDKSVEIIMHMKHPNIFLIANMLSDDECDTLINVSKSKLYRSKVFTRESGNSIIDNRRTSQTAILEDDDNEIVSVVNKRLCKFLLWPSEKTEKLQVQRYDINQEYQPHHDYFPIDEINNRVATIIIYLNEPEKGGETLFADIGLNIIPRKGMAVFFSYDRPSPATLTLHGGSPVLKGEKWIITKFVRSLD